MDAVTYPDSRVADELTAHWLAATIDVSDRPEVARRLLVDGIPHALAVTADGVVLGRVRGFVEPAKFAADLAGWRDTR